jgi:hypothetical protein
VKAIEQLIRREIPWAGIAISAEEAHEKPSQRRGKPRKDRPAAARPRGPSAAQKREHPAKSAKPHSPARPHTPAKPHSSTKPHSSAKPHAPVKPQDLVKPHAPVTPHGPARGKANTRSDARARPEGHGFDNHLPAFLLRPVR